MDASKITIDGVFARGRSLEIPFFQRAYVWSEDNWLRFLNDMVEISRSKKSYATLPERGSVFGSNGWTRLAST